MIVFRTLSTPQGSKGSGELADGSHLGNPVDAFDTLTPFVIHAVSF